MSTQLPKKIMIFGRPGSGKSTFAYELHKMLKLPLHHLDKHFFESNWIERNYQEFLEIQQSLVDSDAWIIDGNSTKSLEMRYKEADLVIYFNYPRWLCYIRILKRLYKKNDEIDDKAPGCYNTIRLSLLGYMWNFENRVAEKITKLREKYPKTCFLEIKNNKELYAFKDSLINYS